VVFLRESDWNGSSGIAGAADEVANECGLWLIMGLISEVDALLDLKTLFVVEVGEKELSF